jgi:hypothetical protein
MEQLVQMITLSYTVPEEHKPYTPINDFTMNVNDDATLDEMLDAYKSFLLAMGYYFDGTLVVEPFEAEEVVTAPKGSQYLTEKENAWYNGGTINVGDKNGS